MAYRRRANCRFVPTVVKIANADCVCSGAQRAPCRLAMITAQIQRRKASGFVIARSEATWQSREGSCDFAGSTLLSGWVLRDCTPRALPRASRSGRHVGLRPPRNDKPLVFTVLTIACSGRQRCAGPGCPLPYSAHRWLPAKHAGSGSRTPAVRFLLEFLISRHSSR